MIKITEENFNDIDFKGIIVGIPKNPELDFDFSINFECAYYTKGHHGYPERGSHPDNSSFFSIYYNDNYLPNGFFFNSSSRLPWTKEYHYLNNVDYYKFDDMEEFCRWYLNRKTILKEDEPKVLTKKNLVKFLEVYNTLKDNIKSQEASLNGLKGGKNNPEYNEKERRLKFAKDMYKEWLNESNLG